MAGPNTHSTHSHTLEEQQQTINRLRDEVAKLPNSCTISSTHSDELTVKIETYVIQLQDGKIDENSKVIPIQTEVTINQEHVPFDYSKYVQKGWEMQTTKTPKGEKEHRKTIPLFRVNAQPGTTFLRLGHLYPNTDGSVGSTGGIFGLLPEYSSEENPSRYFPDDSTENFKKEVPVFEILNSTIADVNRSVETILKR